MKKHITIAGVLFLTVLFILPMMALGRSGRTGCHSGRMIAVTAPQKMVQPPTLTADRISQIEVLQKKLQDDNADIMKQLMAEIQKEITTKIQEEISNLNTKWEKT